MANKTKAEDASVTDFIAAVEHPGKRADAEVLDALFRRVTGQAARMWGPTIIGYGQYHYRYDSGREGDMCRVGFSPRKQNLTLYLEGIATFDDLLGKLGKHSTGKVCLYVKRLSDIDMATLREIVEVSYGLARQAHGGGT